MQTAAAVPTKKEKTPKLLEVIMYEEVRARYMKTMKTNPDFDFQLDMDWFKHHFAEVAHFHKIFQRTGIKEDRTSYNLYFRLVRQKLSDWLKAQHRQKQQAAMKTEQAIKTIASRKSSLTHCLCEPRQRLLFPGDHCESLGTGSTTPPFRRKEDVLSHAPLHTFGQLRLPLDTPVSEKLEEVHAHAASPSTDRPLTFSKWKEWTEGFKARIQGRR